jgi:hypothetical protein
MRPLVAHDHLGLGKLHLRMGKHQEAKEHLATATDVARDGYDVLAGEGGDGGAGGGLIGHALLTSEDRTLVSKPNQPGAAPDLAVLGRFGLWLATWQR